MFVRVCVRMYLCVVMRAKCQRKLLCASMQMAVRAVGMHLLWGKIIATVVWRAAGLPQWFDNIYLTLSFHTYSIFLV